MNKRDYFAELRMYGLTADQCFDISNMLEETEKQQWNAALDEAAKQVKLTHKYFDKEDNREEFEEYKDHGFIRTDRYGDACAVDVIEVDKQSILKLKKA